MTNPGFAPDGFLISFTLVTSTGTCALSASLELCAAISAASFFAATFGVGLYSNIDMVSSLCTLMARGALISMACVIFLLPAFLMLFDGIIMKTTMKTKD